MSDKQKRALKAYGSTVSLIEHSWWKGPGPASFFSSPRKTWNGRFESGSAYLSEFVGRWQLKSTHQKNSLVSMWDAWCILLSDLETMSQCSIDNMHIVQPSGPKDQCFSLKFNQILLAYLFPNIAISVLALMGVVSLHVRCLFAPKFLWWESH